MQKRIALIIPYFGVLPTYFPYFAESVRHVSSIDVLLFTDAQIEIAIPSNITVYPFTLSDFNRLASRALGMRVAVKAPFKLCDFRPAYAVIFREFILDREFWAFGDIDVVYGDLTRFLAPLMHENDVVSCRTGWISGSFCVLRNCAEANF